MGTQGKNAYEGKQWWTEKDPEERDAETAIKKAMLLFHNELNNV